MVLNVYPVLNIQENKGAGATFDWMLFDNSKLI